MHDIEVKRLPVELHRRIVISRVEWEPSANRRLSVLHVLYSGVGSGGQSGCYTSFPMVTRQGPQLCAGMCHRLEECSSSEEAG